MSVVAANAISACAMSRMMDAARDPNDLIPDDRIMFLISSSSALASCPAPSAAASML